MLFSSRKSQMIDPERALPGRDEPMPIPARHEVLGTPLAPPFPEGFEQIVVAMGCFWGAERVFWQAEAQRDAAIASRETYQQQLSASGYGEITTEIEKAGPFYYAEEYHQQYLAKNPNGYCGLGGTGVSCPIGLNV